MPGASGQASAKAPLSQDPKPVAGEVRSEGLVYSVNADGVSVAFVGWCGDAPSGDVVVPAAVSSGADSYAVVSFGNPSGDGLFAGVSVEHLSIPVSVTSIADGALSGCPTLSALFVNSKNETFASFDGMLFSKDLSSLLLVPAGKEGAALIPDPATSVPAGAFSRAPGLCEAVVGEGSASFSSRNGLLYSKDMKTLVACPPGAGGSVVVPASVEAIADGAFAGCAVASITVLGDVREIASGAFDEKARAEAVVALPGGEGYEARRAAWEAAGFSRFAEPARPGDVSAPGSSEGEGGSDAEGGEGGEEASGLAYEVLEDYTLAASWADPEGPAGEIEIPAAAEVGGVSYRVSAVADAGFAGCSGLTAVSLPAGLAAVGERAFEACGLADVWLPASVASVGPRAFAACPSLGRVVAQGATDAAPDALAECSGVSVYCPAGSEDSWNMGLPAAGNHLMPYGIALADEPLRLEAGRSASLLDGGQLLAPEPVEASYSYAAKPLSVDADGVVAGKAEGSSEVSVALTLDAVELARATRAVEVAAEPAAIDPEPTPNPDASDVSSVPSVAADEAVAETVSFAAVLTTGESFTEQAASGQMLTYTVPADDPTAVEVAAAAPKETTGHLVVPSKVEDASGKTYTVRAIAASAFDSSRLETVSFEPDSQLETVGFGAFGGCQSLRACALPATVTSIGGSAFFACYSLVSMNIPDSVESLGTAAFTLNALLSDVTLGRGITTLPDDVFSQCASLSTVRVRGTVSTFGKAFPAVDLLPLVVFVPTEADKQAWEAAKYGIASSNIRVSGSEYRTVTFDGNGGSPSTQVIQVEAGSPATQPVAGRSGFGLEGWYTESGQRWNFASNVTEDVKLQARWEEDVRDGDLVYRMLPDGASLSVFAAHPEQLEGEVVIPAVHRFGDAEYPVTEIAAVGFSGSSIAAVEVPSTVKAIKTKAFSRCASLASLRFAGTPSLEVIETDAFYFAGLETVTLPRSLKRLYREAFGYNPLTSVAFEDGIGLASLPSICFMGCSALESIAIPETVTRIEGNAFNGCASLGSVGLPEGLRVVEGGAFRGCSSLSSISLPVGLQQLGAGAFMGCASLAAVFARGSMGDVGIANAFDGVAKQGASVVLPSVSADGSGQDYATMAKAWRTYGFAKISGMGGPLPTVDNAGNTDLSKAGWSLDADGSLIVSGTEVIADLGWVYNKASESGANETYWGPARGAVKSVSTMGATGVQGTMDCWFQDMPNLVDISDVRVLPGATSVAGMFQNATSLTTTTEMRFPESVTSVHGLFQRCASLEEISAGFVLPANVADCSYLFDGCSELTDLPEGFAFPGSVDSIAGFFSGWNKLESVPSAFAFPTQVENVEYLFQECTRLADIPDGFTLPARATNASGMFSGCSSLASLPEGFTLSSATGLKSAQGMFQNCSSLAGLPSGFGIPGTVTNANYLFYDCTSLAALPSDFSIPESATTHGMFALCWTEGSVLPGGQKVPLYYAGANEAVISYAWGNANRVLVTDKKPADAKATVSLNLVVEGELGADALWTKACTDASGMLAEPAYAPSRPGMVFTLWYADAACTQRVDFSQPFDADATIYGKLAPGARGGALPCEAGTGSAFWTLADDGTLYVRGNGTVKHFIWYNDPDAITEHWAAYRSDIQRVVMDPSVRALNMEYWFYGCSNLIDISGVVIPEGVRIVGSLFWKCSSLRVVPEGFALPASVEEAFSMFRETPIVSLPASFVPSENLYYVPNMFFGCSELESLPEGFTLGGARTPSMQGMLYGCASLKTLPSSFSLPADAKLGAQPFYVKLEPGEPRVPTYYGGDDPSVLKYDWESQNRTLVTDTSDMGEFGMKQVSFKVQSADEAAGFPWETRSTAWTNKQGMLADPGAPQLEGYMFTGWCTDEECLEPFDFGKPVTEDRTLYGKWIAAGAKNAVEQEGGELPCVDEGRNPVDSTVWWRIEADGTLSIRGTGKVGDLKFSWDVNATSQDYWEPYRGLVKRIHMDESVRALTMCGWFCRMPNLFDASGIFVPEGCVNVNNLLYNCPVLTELPPDFKLPSTVDSAGGFMQSCPRITSLPDSFVLPPNMWNVSGMFRYCTSLSSLPKDFTIPGRTGLANSMFENCTSLSSLPEGFNVPPSVKNMDHLFIGCNALTSLPASFDFPLEVAKAASDPFLCTNGTVETYYAGAPDSASSVLAYSGWAGQNRTLTTDVPAGKAFAELMVPNKDTGAYELWTRQLVDVGATVKEPSTPVREGCTFVGWCIDEGCATRFDFASDVVPADGLTLYADYRANNGELPTTDGAFNASWELSDDGTLTIACEPGATVASLWDVDSVLGKDAYWAPVRNLVRKAVMQPGLLAADVVGWFSQMPNLNDVSETFVPATATSTRSMFWRSGSIASLPHGFTLPEGVTCSVGMFSECSSLTGLPAGFSLPDSLLTCDAMFDLCSSLAALPEGFTIPNNVTSAHIMFSKCRALKALPIGFSFEGDTEIDVAYMFRYCSSLTVLPEGFRLPRNPKGSGIDPNTPYGMEGIFLDCPRLTVLPESFDFNLDATESSVIPFLCTSEVPTYYAGTNESVLRYSQWASQRRILYTKDNPPAEQRVVTFETTEDGGVTWGTWATLLSDESNRISDPGIPSRFGYMFSGWYLDKACTQKFDFENDSVGGSVSLYGTYTLMARVDVPFQAKAVIDASAAMTPAPVRFVSFSPVPMRVSSVGSELTNGASKLFPKQGDAEAVDLVVNVGRSSVTVTPGSTDADLQSGGLSATMKAATPLGPSSMDGSIGLELNGAQIDYQPGDDITSFAKLTWTVEVQP